MSQVDISGPVWVIRVVWAMSATCRVSRHFQKSPFAVDGVGKNMIQAPKLELRITRCEFSDREWSVIRPMLPNKPRGIPRVDDRRVLNGIFRVRRSGAPWRRERFSPLRL